MVFSSLEFLLLFLPVTVLGYYACMLAGRKSLFLSLSWLFLASLFYYGYWKPENIVIILASLVGNHFFGKAISGAKQFRKPLFIIAVLLNLASLACYKYTDFFFVSMNEVLGTTLPLQNIILPIGISFFTFQQIAYLSDIFTHKYDPTGQGFLHYGLFVCFFPQLVAGPIVHHREMMPQFESVQRCVNWEYIYRGLIMLSLGLGKKVLVADNLSPLVHHAFDIATNLTFCEAVLGSLLYTLQLYFDFSGYCDMAIGCALLFGIELPLNFNSPYKATDIKDFWRRWHITLSRWLRDYLYIPLGGNRKGKKRMLCNLFLTFLLGGLWHGAAWTFVLWGVMHGVALVMHRIWAHGGFSLPRLLAWPMTFIFVNFAWVVFRALDFACVQRFISAFSGANGWAVRDTFMNKMVAAGFFPGYGSIYVFVLLLLLVTLFLRNSQEMLKSLPEKKLHTWAVSLLALSVLSLCIPDKPQEFIYFQF